MSEYKPTIGLEVHAELKTNTKMFCDSKNDPGETKPNVNVCPICMGHPGTLPVLNKQAIRHVLKVGVAVGGKLADFTEWDRKNYFYPDIPKGYQISQYKYPLVTGGSINGVELTRIHLEEDTARNIHTKSGDSLVDFNRSGIPLMELVTEPVIHSAEQAAMFAKELQLLLRFLGVADANMEKGELRVEANISVSKDGKMGTKVEIKNLNSFKAVERGIDYEIKRQSKEIEAGNVIEQETRGWDESKQKTFSQRKKEYSHDYRYFPEPDLPKLKISEVDDFQESVLKKELPELPWERRSRYVEEFKLTAEVGEMFLQNEVLGTFFETITAILKSEKQITLATNYIASDLVGLMNDKSEINIDPEKFAQLIVMIDEGRVSSRGGKNILREMYEKGGDPKTIAEKLGLVQESSEDSLTPLLEKIVEDNAKVVSEYKAGKESALQFLVGQGMKETKGAGNPKVMQKLLKELLK